MKSKLSVVLDNEANDEEVVVVCSALRHNKDLRDDLLTYTLIGNCLRGDVSPFADLTPSVMAVLEKEPISISGIQRRSSSTHPTMRSTGLALAAAFVGILVVGGTFFFPRQTSTINDIHAGGNVVRTEQMVSPVVVDVGNDKLARAELRESDIREYLIAHQAHSRGAYLGADSQQIRTVSLMDEGSAK